MPESHDRIEELIELVSALPAKERESYLDQECSDSPEILNAVRKRLFRVALDQAGQETSDRRERGERIGPYRVVRRLGEGGMGVVLEAAQERPVRRTVAIKVIRTGLGGRHVLERFETERQALAMMDHPNVARVLDAGADDDNHPYFVMEYIRGEPITLYCDRHRLSTRDRVELMIRACEGVQHAHQKGIIHRDLKPSNILVEIKGDAAVPKIIDFGVAKAVDWPQAERRHVTRFGELIGTPEYMSPEQAEMSRLDIDTRADVYSLGVILYELLTGMLPIDPADAQEAGKNAIRRDIRDRPPPRPSLRVSSLGDAAWDVARRRRTDPASLGRDFRGDLDWVTMRALEKDRTHRYASASELAADLRRYLANEPVSAGPPSVTYRFRKFVRRNRAAVAVTVSLMLTFVAGFIGTATGLARSVRAERQARLEAETAVEIRDFLVGLFQITDPGRTRGITVPARELLDRGADRIRQELRGSPALRGRMLDTMGEAYRRLGLYPEAESLFREAVTTSESVYGSTHSEVARTLYRMGGVLIKQGRAEEALEVLHRALAIQKEVLEPMDLETAATLNNIGAAHRVVGRHNEAVRYLERALGIREQVLNAEHPDVVKTLGNLGMARLLSGDPSGAEECMARVLEVRERTLGPDHPDLAKALDNLATLHRASGQLELARGELERALAIEEKTLGPDHPELINTLINLGIIARADGRLQDALRHFRRAAAIGEEKLGPSHRHVVHAVKEAHAISEEMGGKSSDAR